MYSDNILLRQAIQAGLTTKGSDLTAEEVDANFIAVWQDLQSRVSAGSADAYDSGTSYSLTQVVTYDGKTWVYIFATPASGVTPGSDPDYWETITIEALSHRRNSDTILAEGTTDEVSAAEIRAFLDSPTGGGGFFTEGTATVNTTQDLDGFDLSIVSAATPVHDFYGDGTQRAYESIGVGTGPDPSSGVNVSGFTRGAYLQGTVWGVQANGGTYGVQSSGDYALLAEGNVFGAWGRAGNSSAVGVFASDNSISGAKALQTSGRILTQNLPTSPTGLATGELWNNSGSIDIV